MDAIMPPEDTAFGERVARRLREEIVIWMTTVGADGTPQPNPVWFLWDGTSILIYSLPNAARMAHIRRNPRVALHFDGNGRGGNIVVITGTAEIDPGGPAATLDPTYAEKYQQQIARESWGTPDKFVAEYSMPVRITPTKVRGF